MRQLGELPAKADITDPFGLISIGGRLLLPVGGSPFCRLPEKVHHRNLQPLWTADDAETGIPASIGIY